jgi:hypothetical protein
MTTVSARHVLVIIHGIHTSKNDAESWMPALGKHVSKGTDIEVLHYRYGWRSGVMMRFPGIGWFSRRSRVRGFQKFIKGLRKNYAVADVNPRIDVIAHSYGTWISHYSMTKGKLKNRTSYNRIVYMGSIVHQDQDWAFVPVEKALNLYSPKDKVVAIAPGFGESGERGFDHADGLRVKNLNLKTYSHADFLSPGKAWDEARKFIKA